MKYSVIVEWSNALLAAAERPRKMMEALSDQVERRAAREDPPGGPVQVLVCFDGQRVDSAAISAMAPLAAPGRHGALEVIHCNFPGAEYYALKNLGARRADGAVLVFLDSDVVPQADWLTAILEPFEDRACAVVGGTAFIDPVGLWGKATALNWIFELEPEDRETRPSNRFWANNVAFRREVFIAHPYPLLDGQSRGSCVVLAQELTGSGIPIRVNHAARVTHPAPAGARGFFERAMAQGRDRVLWHRRFGSWWMQSVPAGCLRYLKHLAQLTEATLRHYRKVGARAVEVPAIWLLSATYYLVFLLGEIATHVAPERMKRSFRV